MTCQEGWTGRPASQRFASLCLLETSCSFFKLWVLSIPTQAILLCKASPLVIEWSSQARPCFSVHQCGDPAQDNREVPENYSEHRDLLTRSPASWPPGCLFCLYCVSELPWRLRCKCPKCPRDDLFNTPFTGFVYSSIYK